MNIAISILLIIICFLVFMFTIAVVSIDTDRTEDDELQEKFIREWNSKEKKSGKM